MNHRTSQDFKGIMRKILDSVLANRHMKRLFASIGFNLVATGDGYIDPVKTTGAAKAAGMTLLEYIDELGIDDIKQGRIDRIYEKLDSKIFADCSRICEIGTGTGMYLDRTIGLANPHDYEIYETNPGWVDWLRVTYGKLNDCDFVFHPANGSQLDSTSNESCGLVHANGIFVYIPMINTFSYLKEAARVCKPGKYVVFDCFTENIFKIDVLEKWLKSSWNYPVVIPEKLLLEFCKEQDLILQTSFDIDYSASFIRYFVSWVQLLSATVKV